MSNSIWAEIEKTLHQLYSLPHNKLDLQAKRLTPQNAAKKKIDEIKSGIIGLPQKEDFVGPKLFLRVVGPLNRTYSGEWWFDSGLLDQLEHAYSRIYFGSADRKAAIRDMLRELLAVTTEWNAITEVWALELPAGERLIGYSGRGSRQMLFAGLPMSDKANRMLVGQAKQIVFLVKNPLWVKTYRSLTN